jgi:DNA repair exonuclease SbcCD ATPase subunit
LRGGTQKPKNVLPTVESKKKKPKKKLIDKLHLEAWRKIKPEADSGTLPDGLEIRKMTREGHHVLRVGETWSKRGIKLRAAEAKRVKRHINGIKERENSIVQLEQIIADQKAGRISSSGSARKPVKELEKDLVKLRNDLIRYKDAVHGTTVWKEMTQHTIPHSLRPVDGYQKGDDLQLYKALTETRAIVFNHHKASSAPAEVRYRIKDPPVQAFLASLS